MELVSVSELIEAGAHLGHKISRWNPRMKPYIFGKWKGMHIIDIRETVKGLVTAYYCLVEIARRDGLVIFVGTKETARHIIASQAQRCGMPYVHERWLGGTFTNFETIRQRLDRLLVLEKYQSNGTLSQYNKKEKVTLERELRKLQRNLNGLRNLTRLPEVMVLVDTIKSKHALHEARILNIKTIGLVDTDGDPSQLDIPIAINDDSGRPIQYVISRLADAILEGKSNKTSVITEAVCSKPSEVGVLTKSVSSSS